MDTIESIIRQVAEDKFPAFTYVFESWTDADAKMERLRYPAILCVMPTAGVMSIRNGVTYDTEYIGLAFLDMAPRGADGDDNERVYTSMKNVAVKFINELNRTRKIDPIERVNYDIICERMASIVSGVLLQLEVRQRRIGGCE